MQQPSAIPSDAAKRPPYRPPAGLPLEPDERWGTPVSFAFHVLLILLLITPFAISKHLEYKELGAGGSGPVGGGGGGRKGTGGSDNIKERVQYLRVAPPAPTPQAVLPPVVPAVVPPVVPPPVVPPQVTPPIIAPKPDVELETPKAVTVASLVTGVGGGSGTDGSVGSGPGSGGGVGSGIGTGRGSGVGPGTGGGETDTYAPTMTVLYMPPAHGPSSPRPYEAVALFDVDEKGTVLSFTIEPESRDGGYNRKLREALAGARFRPATKRDGTPVRAVARIVIAQ